MLFGLLQSPSPPIVYSIGAVIRRSGADRYEVKHNEIMVEILTSEVLRVGEWVRFYGFTRDCVVVCEFVQVLQNFDPSLLVKCISILTDQLDLKP